MSTACIRGFDFDVKKIIETRTKTEGAQVFRKLARELVISMFICGFIGAPWAAFYNAQTAPMPMIVITPDASRPMPINACVVRPPNVSDVPGESPSCPPWIYWAEEAKQNGGKVVRPDTNHAFEPPDCPPGKEAWTPVAPNNACVLTRQQLAKIKEQQAAIHKEELSHRREVIAVAGLFGFMFGLGARIVVWILYRAARFAITG
jgi:hypothetical protein